MDKPRVCILYTGGTIGMRETPDGYAPAPGYLSAQMQALPEFQHPALPDYDIQEFEPLLDSANMTPQDWLKIARSVQAVYTRYDGFVVLHGTDTMAYTASALAFLLEGLGKPVILTGSQIPVGRVRSDAVDNLVTALLIASSYPIPEVCLYFGGKLMRGCRATKVNASDMEAFASPNYPLLGEAGIRIRLHWAAVRPRPPLETLLLVREISHCSVGALRLTPGLSARAVDAYLSAGFQGVVLETYGGGTGPDRDTALIQALHDAAQAGLVLVAVTQCLVGGVDLSGYASSSALARAGVVSGHDMTTEAALAKLYYLLGRGESVEEARRLASHNLRGELTPMTIE
jgi:L-asparaginase